MEWIATVTRKGVKLTVETSAPDIQHAKLYGLQNFHRGDIESLTYIRDNWDILAGDFRNQDKTYDIRCTQF